MTKSEICRAIAERMEPLESVKWIDRIENDYESYSPLGFWEREYGRISRTYAPDFFQNESANALLRESMPPMLIAKCRLRNPGESIQWDIQVGSGHDLHEDYKTAMVLAKCRELGIEVGEIEE